MAAAPSTRPVPELLDIMAFGLMGSVRCTQALSVAELYGVLDTDTRDWTDGLLSNIFREINKPLPAGKVRPLKACR